MNYGGSPGTFIIRALDDTNNVLESLTISGDPTYDIITPASINAGAFRGFDLGTNVIRSFEMTSSTTAVITDLSFSALALPGAPELDASGALLPFFSAMMLCAFSKRKSLKR